MTALSDGRIVSGSYGANIQIWNIGIGECERTLEGHTDVSDINSFLLNTILIRP